MIPIANKKYVALPANGRSASAACEAVVILVIPFANRIAPHAAMMKNMTRLDKIIPDQTSTRIVLSASGVVPRRDAIDVLPCCTASSTSCDVCQKNKYGEIVVPKIAQMISSCSLLNVMLGVIA